MVAANYISDSWDSWWAWITTFNEKAFWRFFALQAAYIVMPLVGGYTFAEAHVQYMKDPATFKNSGISEDYIFVETMEMFKMSFWNFFDLLDENGNIKSF